MRALIVLSCMLVVAGCTTTSSQFAHIDPDNTELAELTAEKGTIWGAFRGRVATTAIKEVDWLAFEGYRHPIKIDDRIRLRPGAHVIGVRLWGSPVDFRVGHESYICVKINVNPGFKYAFRGGFRDNTNFQLDLIASKAGTSNVISTWTVPLDVRPNEPICPLSSSIPSAHSA